jgi:hypothetical protein
MSLEFPSQKKSRDSRILGHSKAYAPKILSRIPNASEGNNGDIEIGNTPSGIKLFTKVSNKWYSFSTEPASTSGRLHIINGGFYAPYDADFYLPLTALDEDSNLATDGSDNPKVAYIFPFNGAIKKIILRSDATPDAVTISIYKAENGTGTAATLVEASTELDMSTAYTSYSFNFDGARISTGEIISIKVEQENCFDNANFTIVIEYD